MAMIALWPATAPWAYTIATFITQTIWELVVNGYIYGFNNPAESITRIIVMTVLTGILGLVGRGIFRGVLGKNVNTSKYLSFDADRLMHSIGVKDVVGRITIEVGKLTAKGLGVFAGIRRLTSEFLELFFKLSKIPRRDLEKEYQKATASQMPSK